jgi:opacity protein-like surface antigen
MKSLVCLCSCVLIACASTAAWAQGNKTVILSGGYAFADVEDTESNADGWCANLVFETSHPGSHVVQGFGIGFAGLTSTGKPKSDPLAGNADYTISTLPIYWAPKLMYGEKQLKGFLSGALGGQISWLSRSGPAGDLSDRNGGFYGGVGAGARYDLNAKWSLEAEYQWAYMSNSYYRDGFLNSVMIGIGKR